MKTGSRPNLERENPAICGKSGGDAVKLKTFLITASLWMGLLGLTACGLECADCPLYQEDCPGCNECAGRVFHAPPGKPCPLYAFAVNRKHRTGCGGCADAPCALWEQVRDPALSEEEFRASVAARLKNLNEVPEIGRRGQE